MATDDPYLIHSLSIALDCGVYGKCGSVARWSVSKQVTGTWGGAALEDSLPSTHLCADTEEINIPTLGVGQFLAHCGKEPALGTLWWFRWGGHKALPGSSCCPWQWRIRTDRTPVGTSQMIRDSSKSSSASWQWANPKCSAPEIFNQGWMGGWNSWIGKCTVVPFSHCFYKRCRFITVTDEWDQSPCKSQGNTWYWALINQWGGSSIIT